MTRELRSMEPTTRFGAGQACVLAILLVAAWPAAAQDYEPDVFEPDDSLDIARPIALGERQSHTYHEGDESDYGVVEVKEATTYTVRTLDLSHGVDTIIGVWLAEDALFTFDDDSGDQLWASKVVFEAPITGPLYIEAVSLGAVGAYDLLVEEGGEPDSDDSDPDPFEPDDEPASASAIEVDGPAVRHTFHRNDEDDWAMFDAVAGDVYQIWTSRLQGDADTLLSVWTEDAVADIAGATPLAEDDDGGPYLASRVINLRSPVTGPLYVNVFNLGAPRPGSYELHVTAGVVGDAYEPDNSQEEATAIATDGAPQMRGFHEGDTVDWLTFRARPDRWYTISTDNLSGVDTVLEVYDEGGDLLYYDDDGGAGTASRLSDVELPEGTIYVAVRNFFFFFAGIGDYEITVEDGDPDTEAPTGVVSINDAKSLDGVMFVPDSRIVLAVDVEDNHVDRSRIYVGVRNGDTGDFAWKLGGGRRVTWQTGPSSGIQTVQVMFADPFDNESSVRTLRFVVDGDAPAFDHSPIDRADVGEGLSVTGTVTDATLVDAALYYRSGGSTRWNRLTMDLAFSTSDTREAVAEIPADALSRGVAYYVEATDLFDRITAYPERGASEDDLPADGAEAAVGVRVFGSFEESEQAPAQTWRPFSIPVAMPDGTAGMAETLDRLIAPDEWQVMRWTGEDEYADTPRPQMARGLPLWMISKRPYRLAVDDSLAPDPTVPATMDLDAGWNFVANPFPFPVRFGNVRVDVGDGLTAPIVDEAAAAFVRPRFWRWDDPSPNDNSADGRYVVEGRARSVWEPWSGYWLLTEQAVSLTVQPYDELHYSVLLDRPPAAPSKPAWSAALLAEAAGATARVEMALLRTANWGRDAYDIAQPPSPATLRLSMVHESGRYQRLVLPTDATDWVWQAELDSDAPSRLTISAPPPDGRHLYIKQVWDGVRRELRADASIHAPAGTRRFRLRLTRERLGPDIADAPTRTTALLANYPNPFNPETWIPFTLAEMSSVAIAIYDTRGLPVRQISLGDLPAGRYSEPGRAAHWDGRNEFGETVASGVYIYELRAAGRRELRRMVLLQ